MAIYIPKDLLESIFRHLHVTDVARGRAVCRSWRWLLSSDDFLVSYKRYNDERWVAVSFDDSSGLNTERMLILYNATLRTWHHISLDFLPPAYTADVVAAAGGLLCLSGQLNGKMNVLCVCNPLTRTYKLLPDLGGRHQQYIPPVVVMIEGNLIGGNQRGSHFEVLVLNLGDTVALYSSARDCWKYFKTGLPYRPRSPVACDGIVYGLQNMGSPWHSRWRLVYAKLDETCRKEVWCALHRAEWGEILDILRQPRLLESNGSLLLTGGLRGGSTNNNSCSSTTFIILKLDLSTLEWSEAQRMPLAFFKHFDPGADFKVFGGQGMVYFSSKTSTPAAGRVVVCDLCAGGGEGEWRWVEGTRTSTGGGKNGHEKRSDLICKGFPLNPTFDVFFH